MARPDERTCYLSSRQSSPSESMETKKTKIIDSVRTAAFIIGTAAVVFIALRNSVTLHLSTIWGISESFWQGNWSWLYRNIFKGDLFLMMVVGTNAIGSVVFFSFNAFLIFIDVTGKPEILLNYKIQPTKNVPVDPEKLKSALARCVFNMLVVNTVTMYFIYPLYAWRGCPMGEQLPWFHWVCLEIVVFSIVEEVMFYYVHRLLHHKSIYKYIHKIHHEWTAPIGIIGVYAHPIEHIISNFLPLFCGPLLMKSHITTMWLWTCIALVTTSISHCGYHFPFLPSPEAHDYHHLKFNQNFGVLGVLDRLHGTDSSFRQSKAYNRHVLHLSLVPLRELVPDQEKSSCSESER